MWHPRELACGQYDIYHVCVCHCRCRLPPSLEVVYLRSYSRLDLWLPALTALLSCHSLRLIELHDSSSTRYDELTIRSGLAASPSLRLLCCNHFPLPLMAAERTARGLPPVETGPPAEDKWCRHRFFHEEAAVNTPDARIGLCTSLPSIDTTPSPLTHCCQTCATLLATQAVETTHLKAAATCPSSKMWSSVAAARPQARSSDNGNAGGEIASDHYHYSESMGD